MQVAILSCLGTGWWKEGLTKCRRAPMLCSHIGLTGFSLHEIRKL